MNNNWAEEARLKVLAAAFKDIKAGKDINMVLEQMSKSLTAKLMHPLLVKLKSPKPDLDLESHRTKYNQELTKCAINKPSGS
jgi:glutamyl-tRNA reductase